MKIDAKLQAALSSYGRSFLAAALAVWSTGNHDIKGLVAAGLAAVLPVAMRALNPKDPAFGLLAKVALPEVEKQLASIIAESNKKAKKAPAKKATAKKAK
jgi:hypothetical protein